MKPQYTSNLALVLCGLLGGSCGGDEPAAPPSLESVSEPAQGDPAQGDADLEAPPAEVVGTDQETALGDLKGVGEGDTAIEMVGTGEAQEIKSEEFTEGDSLYWEEEMISNDLIAGPLLALKVHMLGEWSGASSLPEIGDVFYPDAKISAFSPAEFDESEVADGVVRRDWKGEPNYLGLEDWLDALAAEHAEAKRMRWAVCKPAYVSKEGDVVTLTMKYRFNRELLTGGLRHDHGYWDSEWTLNEDGEWRCRKMGPKKDCYTIESDAPHFVDVSAEALAGTYFDPRLPKEMKGVNRNLVVADFNKDNAPDLLLTLPTRMLFNRGDGTFRDVTDQVIGPKFASADSKFDFDTALAADFDHDGDMDFICTGKGLQLTMFQQQPDGRFYARGTGVRKINFISASLSAHDVDGDGFLDIFVAGYGPFINPGPDDPTSATNARANYILRNLGDGVKFEDVTEEWGLNVENTRWAFIGAWGDADNDGDLDLYVANDFGPNVLYRRDNTEKVHFTHELQDTTKGDIGFSMSATWGDLDGDLDNDLYISNMSSTAAKRVSAMDGDPTQSEAMDMNSIRLRMSKGNTIHMQTDDKKLTPASSEMGARGASWAWGTALFDYDCDGDLDIHCVNGFWSEGADDGRDL